MRNFYEVKFDEYMAGDLMCTDNGMLTVIAEAEAYRVQHLCELDHTAYAGAMEYVSRRSYGRVERYDRSDPRLRFEADWRVYKPSMRSTSYCQVSYYRNPTGVNLSHAWDNCDYNFVAADLMSGIARDCCSVEVTAQIWHDFCRFLDEVNDFCRRVYGRRAKFWSYLDGRFMLVDAVRVLNQPAKRCVCESAAEDVGLRGFGRYL